ncbi:MAG: hypothetical protein HFF36_08695 [Coprobacillus sp.]|nr:hypothetical protein [Coprobacillus sp.]MCI9093835.1 hypothetical protein [Coprobacillus sp.]
MSIYKNKIIRHLLVIISVIFLFVAIYLLMGINYAVCDDTAMRNIASGAQTGTPDGHLVYIMYPLGWFMATLYKINNHFDWYGIVFIVLQAICLIRIVIRLLNRCQDKKETILTIIGMIVFFLVIWNKSLTNFQFSTTAAILSGTSCFIIYEACRNDDVHWKDIIESLLFLIVSMMVRKKVALMAMAFYSLIFLYYRFDWKKRKIKDLKKWIVFPFFVLCVFFATPLNNLLGYSSSEWEEYKKFNLARSNIYDYYGVPEYEENIDFYNSLGIDENEFSIIKSYSLKLDDSIDKEKMIKIAEKSKEIYNEERGNIVKRTVQSLNKALSTVFDSHYLSFWMWIFISIGFSIYLRKHQLIIFQFLMIISMCFGFFYLCWEGRMPERTIDSIFIVVCLSMGTEFIHIKHFLNEFENPLKKGICVILSFITLCCTIDASYCTWILTRDTRKRNNDLILFEQYLKTNEDNFYFTMVNVGLFGYSSDFHIKYEPKSLNYLGLGGWGTNAPTTNQKQINDKIENVINCLFYKDNCYLMTHPSYEIETIVQALQNKYGKIDVKLIDEQSFESLSFNVYKLEK